MTRPRTPPTLRCLAASLGAMLVSGESLAGPITFSNFSANYYRAGYAEIDGIPISIHEDFGGDIAYDNGLVAYSATMLATPLITLAPDLWSLDVTSDTTVTASVSGSLFSGHAEANCGLSSFQFDLLILGDDFLYNGDEELFALNMSGSYVQDDVISPGFYQFAVLFDTFPIDVSTFAGPGESNLVSLSRQIGIELTPLPGPSSLVTLTAAGLYFFRRRRA